MQGHCIEFQIGMACKTGVDTFIRVTHSYEENNPRGKNGPMMVVAAMRSQLGYDLRGVTIYSAVTMPL